MLQSTLYDSKSYIYIHIVQEKNNVLSEPFQSMQGVKQGDPLSPLMFIFFINDLKREIEPGFNNQEDVFILNELKLFSLMYADDAVLFSKTKQGLQIMLDKLSNYCNTWSLKVNTDKTKVMVFEKGIATDIQIYFQIITEKTNYE